MSYEKETQDAVNDEGETKSSSSFIVPRSSLPSARVFCAVELPGEVRARAAQVIERLREAMPEVRASWERPEKMHVTLKFVGEIAPQRVEALSSAAERAAGVRKPFKLALSGTGSFPPRGDPRVLWLGIEDEAGALKDLQQSLEDECQAKGFRREDRPFHPHLTLCRIRAPRGARELARLHREAGFEAIEFAVARLLVIRSELGPGGSRYTEISRHEFGARPSL